MRIPDRWSGALAALFSASLMACASPNKDPATAARVLAPTGTLRVGVYSGSPSSIVGEKSLADAKGVGHDLGRALAARLGVPFAPIVFPSNAQVLAAVEAGTIDVTFTNATEERAQHMDFSGTYMDVEKSFLVSADSQFASLMDLRKAKVKVGVSAGSSTAEELRPLYPDARLVPIPTLAKARQMLAQHDIDAFATNDAILFEMSDGLAGSRVVPGHWGMEHFGAAIPKGRTSAIGFLNIFIDEAVTDGTVNTAIVRAHLRGTLQPPP